MYKLPAFQILKDHGPGAKIGLFYEAPAFYAQGKTFLYVSW